MIKLADRALFIGRFQPFHHGHLAVVESLLAKHQEVIIAIGSAECCSADDNPFSAGERVEIIRASLLPEQLKRVIIIPVRDINNNSLWVSHLKSYVPEFSVVYTNNKLVSMLFLKAGIKVDGISYIDRGLNEGKVIRKLMSMGDDKWKKHVPCGAHKFILSINGIERMRAISERE